MNVNFFIYLQNPVLSCRITALNPTAAMYDSGFISTTDGTDRHESFPMAQVMSTSICTITIWSYPERLKKHCPSFEKTLPVEKQNIAHDKAKHCSSFYKATGNGIWDKRVGVQLYFERPEGPTASSPGHRPGYK